MRTCDYQLFVVILRRESFDMKSTQEYIDLLMAHATELRTRFGISSMRLFGSVARGEQRENSDVDIFVEMPATMKDVCGAQLYLENLLRCDVDLIRKHKNLSPFFLNQVEKYGITIFRPA